jgi:hypothetical protein
MQALEAAMARRIPIDVGGTLPTSVAMSDETGQGAGLQDLEHSGDPASGFIEGMEAIRSGLDRTRKP